ncbi:MAG TPA: hypothetical protein VGZ32_06360 [Actinocrinis sp.]|uniref:hypothetical protein n=1 Tax=Actinocrinis sp. TaxID=1920516 RepID=UPI002DDD7F22|nr:hypothetical protein [Actinocrinis sp.]HEV3169941.1 hypothetical protein [Actinocrinis sp.]
MDETSDGLHEAADRAANYIRGHGGPFDRARFAAVAGAGLPEAEADANGSTAALEPPEPQNPDGGWAAPWSGGASSLDATCFMLDQLSDLDDARTTANVSAALEFIEAAQSPDGTWREGQSDRTPDWLMPGSAPARAYLTANCARTLLVAKTAAEAVERAARALEWALDPHGRLPGPMVAHWLAARVFRETGRELAARRLLDVVGRVFDQLDTTDLAWFGSDTQPGDRWTKRIALRLAACQEPDGSWIDESGRPSALLTVTVCRVLLRA